MNSGFAGGTYGTNLARLPAAFWSSFHVLLDPARITESIPYRKPPLPIANADDCREDSGASMCELDSMGGY
eukprot:scaffold900_cov399-Pavlova_lutheri.AAC.4